MPLDFGIEIECLIPGQGNLVANVARGVAADITAAGVGCYFAGYSHARSDHWKVVTDASIRAANGYVGIELVSPPLSDPGIDQVDTVCQAIHAMGARTNRSCGLHVHIGARNLTIPTMKRLALLYIENESVIDALMPPSRRGNSNQYCFSIKGANLRALEQARDVAQIASALRPGGNRYVKLNFASYWKHGTVEFRQHSGTIDPVKIKRWVGFCQKLVDVAGTDTPIQMPAQLNIPSPRGRRQRVVIEMVRRPEGVTGEEVRLALGVKVPLNLAVDLGRLDLPFVINERRGGHKVYKLVNVAPATLASLLEKLRLEEEEQAFWRARHELLSNIVHAVTEEGESGGSV